MASHTILDVFAVTFGVPIVSITSARTAVPLQRFTLSPFGFTLPGSTMLPVILCVTLVLLAPLPTARGCAEFLGSKGAGFGPLCQSFAYLGEIPVLL